MTRSVGVAIVPGVGAAIVDVAEPGAGRWLDWSEAVPELRRIEGDDRPRWVWWPHETPAGSQIGIRPARCWDLGAVHRMLVGGWRGSPTAIWATCHDLDLCPHRSRRVRRTCSPTTIARSIRATPSIVPVT